MGPLMFVPHADTIPAVLCAKRREIAKSGARRVTCNGKDRQQGSREKVVLAKGAILVAAVTTILARH